MQSSRVATVEQDKFYNPILQGGTAPILYILYFFHFGLNNDGNFVAFFKFGSGRSPGGIPLG